jgi:hypothetical protein
MTILKDSAVEKNDFIPDYALELTQNYSLYSQGDQSGFRWHRRPGSPLIYDFSFENIYRKKLFHVGNSQIVHIDPNAGAYLPLKSLPSAKAIKYLKEFEITRLTLQDTLEDLWNSGDLAEWYMYFVLKNKIAAAKILTISPLLLTFFDIYGEIADDYKMYPQEYLMGLAKITSDKDELLSMLNGLPTEVIEAMI